MIIVTGVAGPSGRKAERVCKGSAPPGHCPMPSVLMGVPYKGPSPRPFGLRAAPALDGASSAVVSRTSAQAAAYGVPALSVLRIRQCIARPNGGAWLDLI